MTLRELQREINGSELHGANAIITGIAYDSRKVQPGDLFVAVPGFKADGAKYIEDALRRGAAAVLCERDNNLPASCSALRVSNVRRAMAEAAWSLFGHPERKLRLAAITGTNGKTTTAALLHHLLVTSGRNAGTIGTLGLHFEGAASEGARTTPEAIDMARGFSEMHASGVTHVVLEATSIGIELDRVWGLPFDIAIFTNLTRDHMDFHGTEEKYLAAKLRLFSERRASDCCIINADDPSARAFEAAAAGTVTTYGIASGSFRATNLRVDVKGCNFTLQWPQGTTQVTVPLLGRFNVYNSLAAMTAGWAWGLDVTGMVHALASAKAARGRAELIATDAPYSILVDYAHTPDALDKILRMVRELQPTQLIVVFGAGGDRDRGKRPLMGAVAGRLADHVIVTSDNPRSEEPQAIVEEIIAGLPEEASYQCALERREAIALALKTAKRGAAIVIAGKGHETYQEIGARILDFDDTEVVRECLLEMGYSA